MGEVPSSQSRRESPSDASRPCRARSPRPYGLHSPSSFRPGPQFPRLPCHLPGRLRCVASSLMASRAQSDDFSTIDAGVRLESRLRRAGIYRVSTNSRAKEPARAALRACHLGEFRAGAGRREAADQASSSVGNSTSWVSSCSAAATGIATSAPTIPNSAPPIRTATIVTPAGTLTARPITLGTNT